jgi:hypothetical protein
VTVLVNGLAKKVEKDMVIDSVSGLLVGRLSGNVVKDNAGNVLSNILVKSTGEIIDTTGKRILSRGLGNGVTATLAADDAMITAHQKRLIEYAKPTISSAVNATKGNFGEMVTDSFGSHTAINQLLKTF